MTSVGLRGDNIPVPIPMEGDEKIPTDLVGTGCMGGEDCTLHLVGKYNPCAGRVGVRLG
jgi:hypothetical protein